MMTTNIDEGQPSGSQNAPMAALVHIAGLLFGFVAIVFVYFVSNNNFTQENAANALNWHIPLSLVAIMVVIIGIEVNQLAGVVMAIGIVIATVCFALIASIKARHGQAWKYPIVPNFI